MMLDEQLHSLGDVVERLDRMGVDVSVGNVDEHEHRGTLLATLELEVPTDLDIDDTPVGSAYPAETVEGAAGEDTDDETETAVESESEELECPHDDCPEAFETRRQLRGHLGSSEHGLDVPGGEFWCGYCGYGPTTWRGVNAHHGSSGHDGDLIRLESEPDRDDLVAPEDVPDHKNPDVLEELYERHDGNYTEMCREHEFDVTPGRVRHYLIEFDIHEPTPNGASDGDAGPVYRDPEWHQQRYEAADGNISEMHRQARKDGYDIPYRTLQKNLKRFDIHDPTNPRGKRHKKAGPPPETGNEDGDGEPRESRDEGESGGDAHDQDGGGERHQCPECDYTTDSERGLAIHRGRVHGESDDDDQEETGDGGTTEVTESQLNSETTVEPASNSEPEQSVEEMEFADIAPDWLDEASFFQAVDIADDLEQLGDTLGWREYDQLEDLVGATDADEDLPGYEREVIA